MTLKYIFTLANEMYILILKILESKLVINIKDQQFFLNVKKAIALLFLIGFLTIGTIDFYYLFKTGIFNQSFESFYNLLIFSNILIALIALRYTTKYVRFFRYPTFLSAIILIRISLSLDAKEALILVVSEAAFVLILTVMCSYMIGNEQLFEKVP